MQGLQIEEMASSLVMLEHVLEGASNFSSWKNRILTILEEHELDHFVTNVGEEPSSNDGREAFKINQARARRIIFYLIKDKMMTILAPLKTTKECFDTLTNLYEKKAPN